MFAKAAEERSSERHRVIVDLRIAIGAENATPLFAPFSLIATRVEIGQRVFGDSFSDAPSLRGAELRHSVLANVQEAGAGPTRPTRAFSGQEPSAVFLFDEREGPSFFEMPLPGTLELRSLHSC